MFISSVNNQRIKDVRKLEKASERIARNLFVAEGLREVSLAQRGGYEIETIFVCYDKVRQSETYNLNFLDKLVNVEIIEVSEAAYESIAYRESTEGILATIKPKELNLASLNLSEKPLILVIEAIEKPGNLGAMLRTADAAGIEAVIICDPKTDVYNPNVIRSSLGTVFTNQIATAETSEVTRFLNAKKISSYAAYLETEKMYYQYDFRKPTAIVVGSEANGLSDEWIQSATHHLKIPMLGEIDSLNVSVSAAILLYDAVRQRFETSTNSVTKTAF